jgi:uncharacterized protein (TIGR02265 family)
MFAQALESLFRHAVPEGGLPLHSRERLRVIGIDLDRPLLPAYPVEAWVAALEVAADALYPEGPRDEAYRALGRRIVRGYTSTLLGRASLSLGRMLGPRRMLERLTQNLRLASNFMEARLTRCGPRDYEVWLNTRVRTPAYYEGFITQALELVGAREVRVRVAEADAAGFTYRVRWEGPE